MRGALAVLTTIALFLAAPARAAETGLMLPAACAPGQDCWIVNYPDMNPEKDQAQDYTCSAATYDGHEGTDFALRDTTQMKSAVSVLAVAPGRVARVRDGLPDRQPTKEEIDAMLASAKGCGNGILIDHDNGWQSIYCQLQAGSVAVKQGDRVTAGQKIAEIGQSGAAEFPHLHFGLFHNGKTVDPFSGSTATACGQSKGALWMTGISVDYQPMSIFAAGFTAATPDFDKIRRDASSPTTVASPVTLLAYWAGLYGLHKGDRITLIITGPDGKTLARQVIDQKEDAGRRYYYVGRKLTHALPPGLYRGHVTIERAVPGSKTETLRRNADTVLKIEPQK